MGAGAAPPTGANHGGDEAAVKRAPALLPQHHARAMRDAAIRASRADRQPRADELQRIYDRLPTRAQRFRPFMPRRVSARSL